ncbi:MAG TPA: DUF4446 family protein [Actinomycetota bacterium]|nr:DUF4446 family protein [Actinomycetota bacterium]
MAIPTDYVALALGALALAVAVGVFISFASVRRRLIILQGKSGQSDMLEAVARQVEEVHALRGEFKILSEHLRELTEAFRSAVQRTSVYRYDAFEDMGGKLSFSAAFLDAKGDGLVISCINGRQEARTYAKPVEAARSAFNLSPEEVEAIRRALAGEPS